jgi:hypothetical protein
MTMAKEAEVLQRLLPDGALEIALLEEKDDLGGMLP